MTTILTVAKVIKRSKATTFSCYFFSVIFPAKSTTNRRKIIEIIINRNEFNNIHLQHTFRVYYAPFSISIFFLLLFYFILLCDLEKNSTI